MSHQIGNVVYLNSGSPELTVVGVQDEGSIVRWKNEQGVDQYHLFPNACLTSDYTPNI